MEAGSVATSDTVWTRGICSCQSSATALGGSGRCWVEEIMIVTLPLSAAEKPISLPDSNVPPCAPRHQV